MTRRTRPLLHVVVLLCTLILAAPAWAQQASGIAGLVRDSSGAVLPGVTVEAASPALIEKVRTAVTDAQGRFNIVNLRPGTYVVTFSLPGFNSVKREGIQLTAGFTAAVNADMQVGALEETITVSGESPLIDTQNTRQQKVLSSELLEALPSGQKTAINVVSLTPGMTTAGLADVGGSLGTYNAGGNGTTFHGKTGFKREFDGMRVENMEADGNNGYILNAITVQETTVETGGVSAESDMSGVSMNMIPKEGGNTFRYMAAGLFTNEHLSTDNFGDDLRARGVTLPSKVINIYDGWGTVGGPIKQDKLWFFAAERIWGNRNQRANTFWNSTQGTPFYTPDPARPFQPDEFYRSHSGRVTWQASQRNKVNFFLDVQKNCKCYSGTGLTAVTTTAPEADAQLRFWPQFLAQVGVVGADHGSDAARSGIFRDHLALAARLQSGREHRLDPDHRSLDRLRLRRAGDAAGPAGQRPLRPAVQRLVHHRVALLQERLPARSGRQEPASVFLDRLQLHVPARRADADHPARHAVPAQGAHSRRPRRSSRRISGR